jgi:hypothetical protein
MKIITLNTTGYGADGIGISYASGTGEIEGFVVIDDLGPASPVPEPGTFFFGWAWGDLSLESGAEGKGLESISSV